MDLKVCRVSDLDAVPSWIETGVRSILQIHQIWLDEVEAILTLLRTKPQFFLICFVKPPPGEDAEEHQPSDTDLKGFAVLREKIASSDTTLHPQKHLHISWLACRETGQGHGLALMRHVIQLSHEAGSRRITLTHRKHNDRLSRFYQKVAKICGLDYCCQDRENLRLHIIYTW